jgi:hypothetical protein
VPRQDMTIKDLYGHDITKFYDQLYDAALVYHIVMAVAFFLEELKACCSTLSHRT